MLDEAYIEGLDEEHDALKGFHPIEYLLWGVNGDKKAADLTDREKEYLVALAQNLFKLANEVKPNGLADMQSLWKRRQQW